MYNPRVEDVCGEINEVYEVLSKKYYKLGTLFLRIEDNMKTIEKYFDNNLKDTYRLGDLHQKLRTSFYSSCNQLKKPASVLTTCLKPICKRAVADFQSVYDVDQVFDHPETETENGADQELQHDTQEGALGYADDR